MFNKVLSRTTSEMEKSIENLKHEFSTIRTGRASLSLIQDIKVEYYGTQVPLNQVGNVSIPDARLIEIKPWEQKMVKEIERAILKSDLGITPNNDGKVVRLPIPALTEERRKELAKITKKMAEDHKVTIRNIRRESNENLKQMEKKKQISEDELRKSEDKVQEITDKFIKKVDELCAHKEKEMMEI